MTESRTSNAEDVVARPPIEVVITGVAKVGKTSVASCLAAKYGGSYVNLSVLNRLLAWRVLQLKLDTAEPNREKLGRILDDLLENVKLEPGGGVRVRGEHILDQLEVNCVSVQASRQSAFVYEHFRERMTPVLWQEINRLKHLGPIFIVARRRKSIRTARRAFYLDATVEERARRLAKLEGLPFKTALADLRERDMIEGNFGERGDADVVIDTTNLSLDDTVEAVADEYEKAELAALGQFYALRNCSIVSRQNGERILERLRSSGEDTIICCADLDFQGKFTSAFGFHMDLTACFLAILASVTRRYHGWCIAWGTDDVVLTLPTDGHEARQLLERIRREYLLGNRLRFGVGRCSNWSQLSSEQRMKVKDVLGEIFGYYAGEDLFLFEVLPGQDLEAGLEQQSYVFNRVLARTGVTLEATPFRFVPISTVSLGGVLLRGGKNGWQLQEALTTVYATAAAAKASGRNTSILRVGVGREGDAAHQESIHAPDILEEIEAVSRQTAIPPTQQREQYPAVHRVTALERLISCWLRAQPNAVGFCLCLNPRYGGELIDAKLNRVPNAMQEERADVSMRGYRFKTLCRIYGPRDRDILIRVSIHDTRTAIHQWIKQINVTRSHSQKVRIACHDCRSLEGLRLPVRGIFVFEGVVSEEEIFLLLVKINRLLEREFPGFRAWCLAYLAPLGGATSGRELLERAEILDRAGEGHQYREDQDGNVLRMWTRGVAQADELERRKQQSSLQELDEREQELRPLLVYETLLAHTEQRVRGADLDPDRCYVDQCLLVLELIHGFTSLSVKERHHVVAALCEKTEASASALLRILLRTVPSSDRKTLSKELWQYGGSWVAIETPPLRRDQELYQVVLEYVRKHGAYPFGLRPVPIFEDRTRTLEKLQELLVHLVLV